ncbi:hypothetical protein FHI69_02820 [Janthinobacterium lividum]|uniref:Uncharacterized protein n=1 Tax=Janthinobacterium lividum TaxID=29581 RepID=A0A5C4NTP0_9BURK|nr:hypothetical protein [Janthinobacterium lividum]TNC78244.1 hypothetical protein FHI69_02820 [Janthinobacterium lividum]
MSRIRKPLSIEQLKEIQGRNDSADVRALLWEVRRLREIAATADELERSLSPRVGMSGLIRASLRVQLDGQPCFVPCFVSMQPSE